LLLDDVDAIDRARVDEVFANPAVIGLGSTFSEPAEIEPRGDGFRLPALGAGDLAFPAMVLVAAVGWGAFLYEKMRPHDLEPPRATAEAPGAVAATPLEARARMEFSALQRVARRAAVPSSLAPAAAAAATSAPSTAPPATAAAAASAANISGAWSLIRAVESSSYNAFTGMTFGYELRLQQTGARITGSGSRISENGRALEKQRQVPVQLRGTIDGDKLTLNFTEGTGSGRRSGRFLLVVEDASMLKGRFTSNAASSKGTAEAQRQGA
jgi:hypothetical protein